MQTGSLLYIAMVLLARSSTAENLNLCNLRCAVGGITTWGTAKGEVCDPEIEKCPPCFNSERPTWSIMGDGTVTCYEKEPNGRCKSKQTDCSRFQTSPSLTTTSSPSLGFGTSPSPTKSTTPTLSSSSGSDSSSSTTPKPTSKKSSKKSKSSSSSSENGDSSSSSPKAKFEEESVKPTPVPLPSSETPTTASETPTTTAPKSVAVTGEKQDSSDSNSMTIIAAGVAGLIVVVAAFGFILWRRGSDDDDDSDMEDTPKARFQPSYGQTSKASTSSYGQSAVQPNSASLNHSNYEKNAAPYAFNNQTYNNQAETYSSQPEAYDNPPQNYNYQPDNYGNPQYTNADSTYDQPAMDYNNFPPPYYNEHNQDYHDNTMPGPSSSYHSSGMPAYDNSNAYGSSGNEVYNDTANQYGTHDFESKSNASTPGPQVGMDARLSYANEPPYNDLQLNQSHPDPSPMKNTDYYDFSGSGEIPQDKKRTISNASVEF